MEAGVLASPWNNLEGFGTDGGFSVPPGPAHLTAPGTGLHRIKKGFREVTAVYMFLSKSAYYCANLLNFGTLFSTVVCSCGCRHTSLLISWIKPRVLNHGVGDNVKVIYLQQCIMMCSCVTM